MAQKILKQLLEPFESETPPVQTVFDLDSTLFCVSYRTQKIIRELGEQVDFQKRFPKEAEVLRTIEVLPDDWGIRAALIRANLKSSIDFFEEVKKFWTHRFFSNEYLKYDKPYEGALEYLQSLAKTGIPIRYLTGRDRVRMGPGTLETLQKWGFPLADYDHLIMKPTANLNDEEYKTKALMQIVSPDTVTYFFENEPLIIHHVLENLPEVKIIFMESVHSGRAEAPKGLPTLKMRFVY